MLFKKNNHATLKISSPCQAILSPLFYEACYQKQSQEITTDMNETDNAHFILIGALRPEETVCGQGI